MILRCVTVTMETAWNSEGLHPSVPHGFPTGLHFITALSSSRSCSLHPSCTNYLFKNPLLLFPPLPVAPSITFSFLSSFLPVFPLCPAPLPSTSPVVSYESSQEVFPGSPRLTSFPTVSGSPASLARSMDAVSTVTGPSPYRRRPQPSPLM